MADRPEDLRSVGLRTFGSRPEAYTLMERVSHLEEDVDTLREEAKAMQELLNFLLKRYYSA